MSIDIRDSTWQLNLSGRTKRSLIRHFRSFVAAQIRSRGFNPDDQGLFDQDQLDAAAWRLAEEAEQAFARCFDEIEYRDGDQIVLPQADDYVRQEMLDTLGFVEREYLNEKLDGLDLLIQLASGTTPELH